jgi:hypothetical protein
MAGFDKERFAVLLGCAYRFPSVDRKAAQAPLHRPSKDPPVSEESWLIQPSNRCFSTISADAASIDYWGD